MCARVEPASGPETPRTSAPAHLRNGFLDLIDAEALGREACQLVAQAAEKLRTTLGCPDGQS
jgi:hypothetical protein